MGPAVVNSVVMCSGVADVPVRLDIHSVSVVRSVVGNVHLLSFPRLLFRGCLEGICPGHGCFVENGRDQRRARAWFHWTSACQTCARCTTSDSVDSVVFSPRMRAKSKPYSFSSKLCTTSPCTLYIIPRPRMLPT